MGNLSMTGVGVLTMVIEVVLQCFGIQIPEGSILAAVNGIITFVGFVLLVWGQLRRKDLHFGLVRK